MNNKLYARYLALDIDKSLLNLEPGESSSGYSAAPAGAEVIGWEGVDGIHYCFLPGFRDEVFSVEPMEAPGQDIQPLGRTFREFLQVVLACGGASAAQQARLFESEEAFQAFLREDAPDEARQAALNRLKAELDIAPMDHPWAYLQKLRRDFDCSRLKSAQEHPAQEPESAAPWAVYFNGTLWGHSDSGKPGREIPVGKAFSFGPLEGVLPAVYLCAGGLTADVCVSMDWADASEWIERILALEDDSLRERMASRFPLRQGGDLDVSALLNGRTMPGCHGSSIVWYPEPPEGGENAPEAEAAMRHYRLDRSRAWVIWRASLAWPGRRRPPHLSQLTLSLQPEKQSIPGPVFSVEPGERISFQDPATGEDHVLTAREVSWEALRFPAARFRRKDLDYPQWCQTLTYTLEPDYPEREIQLLDSCGGDAPRPVKAPPEDDPPRKSDPAAMGVIGGADGPVAIICGTGGKPRRPGAPLERAACSALYFDKPDTVLWRMDFLRRPWGPVTLDLTGVLSDMEQ